MIHIVTRQGTYMRKGSYNEQTDCGIPIDVTEAVVISAYSDDGPFCAKCKAMGSYDPMQPTPTPVWISIDPAPAHLHPGKLPRW
jgi:hypothetical protein